MPRAAARFSEADLTRHYRAASKACVRVVIDVLPDGTIRSFVNPEIAPPEHPPAPEKDALADKPEIDL